MIVVKPVDMEVIYNGKVLDAGCVELSFNSVDVHPSQAFAYGLYNCIDGVDDWVADFANAQVAQRVADLLNTHGGAR